MVYVIIYYPLFVWGWGGGREKHGFRVVSFYANHLEPAVPGLEPLDASVLGNIVVTGSRV